MTTTYGVTPEGFVAKPIEAVKDDLEAALKAQFGASINLTPASVFGQLVGIFGDRLRDLWEAAEGVYEAFDPDAAAGNSLDRLAGLTGAIRLPAKKSTLIATATGLAGTVLPSGRVASVTGTGARFTTDASATLVAVTAWAAAHAYGVGDRVTNGGNVYQCVLPGTSASSGGPTGTTSGIIDDGVAWDWLGAGAAAVDVACTAEDLGPLGAPAGTLTTIETPAAGWQGVTNRASATLGRNLESDADFRQRREAVLRAAGSGTLDAIRADVSAIEDVTAVRMFENVTAVTDVDGLPPHSFETLVLGGDDDAIGQAIWDAKPAGILAYGTTSSTALDAVGDSQEVFFTRPTSVPIYVVVNLTKDTATWPADGAAQVKAALVAFAVAHLGIGDDVVSSRLAAEVFTISGVVDVTVLHIGTAPAPSTGATVAIGDHELAALATARITVNVS